MYSYKIKIFKLKEIHFYDIRIENRATRDQENMVRLCKRIIYNLAEHILKIKEKRSPTRIYTEEWNIADNTGKTGRPGFE